MAYEIIWEDVLNVAIDQPELADLTTAQQDFIITAATKWVPESRFFTDTFEARAYYAAHLATLHYGPAAGEGTRSSESIGSVSTGVTLAVNNPPAHQRILSTVYGEIYWHYEQKWFESFYVG